MKTSNVSNLSIQNAMRLTILQAQNELLTAQTEVTTGKYADIGVSLGSKTAISLDLTRDVMRLKSQIDTNSIADQRLESSEESMKQMADSAQKMMDALLALSGSQDANSLSVAKKSISDALAGFTDKANTSVNGEYLFSGINTDVKPLDDYLAAGSPAKAAFNAAFLGYFGFNQSSPQTANIVASGAAPSMDDFLTTAVEPMFADPAWGTNWSKATDEVMTSRISQTEVVNTSSSANSAGMRNFAMAAVISIELLGMNIKEDVRKVVSDKAIATTGVATSGINAERSNLGLSQNRVTKATESLNIQQDIMENNLSSLVGVDAYEASTRVNNLLALMEASYTLTAKIQQLSLVNYL